MKQLFGNALSWTLYYFGDNVSKVMHLADWLGILYPIYNKLMIGSSRIQDWCGSGPWERIQK